MKCFMQDKKYEGMPLSIQCQDQPKSWRTNSPEECLELCLNLTGCNGFTWIEKDTNWSDGKNRCCLKNITGEPNITATPGRISGPIFCGKRLYPYT